jgi:hypothetical protein
MAGVAIHVSTQQDQVSIQGRNNTIPKVFADSHCLKYSKSMGVDKT